MKKFFLNAISIGIIILPVVIYAWYAYPVFLDSEDMFLKLPGAFLFTAILYIPILVAQTVAYKSLYTLRFRQVKMSVRVVLGILLAISFLFIAGYFLMINSV